MIDQAFVLFYKSFQEQNTTIRAENRMYQIAKWGFWRWQSSTRYYTVEIVEDLFGTWILRSSWGGLNTRRGNFQERAMPSYEKALIALKEIDERRQSRGYSPVLTIS